MAYMLCAAILLFSECLPTKDSARGNETSQSAVTSEEAAAASAVESTEPQDASAQPCGTLEQTSSLLGADASPSEENNVPAVPTPSDPALDALIDEAVTFGDQIVEQNGGRIAVIPEYRFYPVGVNAFGY